MRTTAEELIGRKFNCLTVVCKTGLSSNNGVFLLCRCDCGMHGIVSTNRIHSGHTKSCGCLSLSAGKPQRFSKHPLYSIWKGMIERCYRPAYHGFANYGGRGIRVCERWHDVRNFIIDMDPRPSLSHSIDRINNNGIYEPDNVRWATAREQQANTRRTRLTEVDAAHIRSDSRRHELIAHDYGISCSLVSMVKTERRWKLPKPPDNYRLN